MFHQVRLLPKDRPLLRFLWRNLERNDSLSVYEWPVLPFRLTCSPCCTIFALQRHVQDHSQLGAQLAKVLKMELTFPIHYVTLWSDFTTVLTWIRSCHYKVFVGTWVAEIQEHTDWTPGSMWRPAKTQR
ncbi:hypothetical protein SKAU_G00016290 [Synaphobranchus kaupii]|uniref:Uncharacterized protein n=1 Tax=Synaphobranchus kaupii TaxID=118154 RepID=A0A9Q1GAX8_SYNKA|nr:hypothetical protein SKAU_G00016290 [Synaphobranchus kaupii]